MISPIDFMKPPICEICKIAFEPRTQGELVYFLARKKNPTALEQISSLMSEFLIKIGLKQRIAISGHPENAAWFCRKHLKKAKKLSTNFEIDEALEKMRD